MRNTLKIIGFGLSFILASHTSFAQKTILVDLTKKISEQENGAIFKDTDLPNLTLKLTGVDNDDDKSNYSISGVNFNDTNTLLELAKGDKNANNEIIFKLAPLEKLKTTDGSITYQCKITYTGAHIPAIFENGNSFTLPINIVATGGGEDRGDEADGHSALEIQQAAIEYVENETDHEKYHSKRTNLFLKDNTVHIYIDENGNFIETGIPTTAKENYLYQVHLLYELDSQKGVTYKFTYDGRYQPEFNIEKTGKDLTKLNTLQNKAKPKIEELDFPVIGPFTDKFEIKLVKKVKGEKDKTLIDHNIEVAKLYHVSISTGLIATTLRNPQNIETAPLANGETTLIADDPNDRGVLTAMATFYPWGRSFLFPPKGGAFDRSRIGIQVGTRLDDNIAENFFLGLSHDFARGGTLSYGLHYGRRNYVAGKRDFDFGKDVFDLPELNIKQEWNLGLYFGVVIDTRVAVELIKSLGNNL